MTKKLEIPADAFTTAFEGDRWVVRAPDGSIAGEAPTLVGAFEAAGQDLTSEVIALLETVGAGNGAVCNIPAHRKLAAKAEEEAGH